MRPDRLNSDWPARASLRMGKCGFYTSTVLFNFLETREGDIKNEKQGLSPEYARSLRRRERDGKALSLEETLNLAVLVKVNLKEAWARVETRHGAHRTA